MTTSRATEDGRWLPAEPSFLAGGKFYMTDPLGGAREGFAWVPYVTDEDAAD